MTVAEKERARKLFNAGATCSVGEFEWRLLRLWALLDGSLTKLEESHQRVAS